MTKAKPFDISKREVACFVTPSGNKAFAGRLHVRDARG
jgi:hypothetical protein